MRQRWISSRGAFWSIGREARDMRRLAPMPTGVNRHGVEQLLHKILPLKRRHRELADFGGAYVTIRDTIRSKVEGE
jgi:hypothetical protein